MLLLVVLSMLVLFAMLALALVIAARQYRSNSRVNGRINAQAGSPRESLDAAAMQIFRGTNATNSALGPHSLLEDMYGGSDFRGQLTAAPRSVGQNQGFDLSFQPGRLLSKAPGYYNGRVLTMIDGIARGKSTRVLGYRVVPAAMPGGPPTYEIRILAFPGIDAGRFTSDAAPRRFVVNGGPFTGTGFGVNEQTGKLDAVDTTVNPPIPFAFAPNPMNAAIPAYVARLNWGEDRQPGVANVDDDNNGTPDDATETFAPGSDDIPISMNEDYDAADNQNMLLAYVPSNPTGTNPSIPSLLRPEAMLYWYSWLDAALATSITNQDQRRKAIIQPWGPDNIRGNSGDYAPSTAIGDQIVALKRKIMLRPLSEDHPQFSGSNAFSTHPTLSTDSGVVLTNYFPVRGPWDVDNDGDGLADSIWVDLGYPVRAAPDGRLYKPLFAVLCIDLDGRLNVNAHGTLTHAQLLTTLSGPYAGSPTPQPSGYLLGHGYGPADINLAYQDTTNGPALFLNRPAYRRLLAGWLGSPLGDLEGRYGEIALLQQMPSRFPLAGVTGTRDVLSTAKQFQYPGVYDTGGTVSDPRAQGAFGSMSSDLWGRTFLGLDKRGMPLMKAVSLTGMTPQPYETRNDPYEIDLAHNAIRGVRAQNQNDNPFTVAELERVLRPYDIDSNVLPQRLNRLLDQSGTSTLPFRFRVTTESYDPPVASFISTREARAGNGPYNATHRVRVAAHIVDLLIKRLEKAAAGRTDLATQLARVISPELMAGLRLDINRPFGNGIDDDGNGIIDDAGEVASEEVWPNGALRAEFNGVRMQAANGQDVNFDGNFTNDDVFARHQFARQLYVLLMLLKDSGGSPATEIDFGDSSNDADETARGLAQWAINVVDFRDRDSIMTPFEYDKDPFNADGWAVDGNLGTTSEADRAVVWGCERPELLITEAFACQDRRTEDLDNDDNAQDDGLPGNPDGKTAGAAMTSGEDVDFDQRLRPRGAAFVEIHNPWADDGLKPGEFYHDGSAWQNGVLLNKLSGQSGDPTRSPVWRLLVVQRDPPGTIRDPEDPVPANRPTGAELERVVYFLQPPNAPGPTDPKTYFSDLPVAPILPGRYCVIGSAGQRNGADYVSALGRETNPAGAAGDGLPPNTTRRIVLTPDADPDVNQVAVEDNGGPAPEPTVPDIQPAAAVVINQVFQAGVPAARSFSISEPLDGYPAAGFDPAAAAGEGAYTTPRDVPLDNANVADGLNQAGTKPHARSIHLQRLADPTLPYDATTNPYLTVDSMAVDLTVFNGVDNEAAVIGAFPQPGYGSTQRGQGDAQNDKPVLWRQEPARVNPLGLVTTTAPPHHLDAMLQHSLGFLTKDWGAAAGADRYDNATAPAHTKDTGTQKFYAGAAINPAPWLTWNDRPYTSPFELLLVPTGRSSRLLANHSLTIGREEAYNDRTKGFQHVFNRMFYKENTAGTGETPAHLYRVFDYLRVPSPYVRTETVLNPTRFTLNLEEEFFSHFRAPFNIVSAYRDPGKVNINTIADPLIWGAIVNNSADTTLSDFNRLRLSRQGYLDTLGTPVPSRFANPFRASSGAELTNSALGALKDPTGASPALPNELWQREDIDVTMLRAEDADSASQNPLFGFDSALPHNQTRRNPYFRYQNLSRLSNMLTTRSNVYAVWITVGYFEVTAWPNPPAPTPDAAHPDGYQLGTELGSDTGEIKRHRAFYIFDRTIPVGFERGQDHNVEDAILLKRFIE